VPRESYAGLIVCRIVPAIRCGPLAKQELCFWNKNPNNEGIRKMNQHRAITSHPHWLLPRQLHRPCLLR